jgi:hypothetical protein
VALRLVGSSKSRDCAVGDVLESPEVRVQAVVAERFVARVQLLLLRGTCRNRVRFALLVLAQCSR